MVINYNCKKLEDPKKFFHSHASGNENIIYTSGMVSRKDDLTGLNIGVKISASESNNKYVHNIELQFLDIIKQLELICEDLEIEKSDLKDHILESKAYIVDVKRYFKDLFIVAAVPFLCEKNSLPKLLVISKYKPILEGKHLTVFKAKNKIKKINIRNITNFKSNYLYISNKISESDSIKILGAFPNLKLS